jgi:hypothetical protein
MHPFVIALVLAACFGLAGTSSSLSAPLSGNAIREAAKSQSVVQEVPCRRVCNRYRCWRRCW